MSNLKQRINRLYAGSISEVSSWITVYKDNKLIKKSIKGNNQQKVIEIEVRL